MLDFSKLFNIIFVAAAGALILFFLSVTIAVAVKGKRKCRAGDVLLRIFATIVFIAAAAMLACSVLTMLDGDFTIAASDSGENAIAVFIMYGTIIELPIADLFIALSTTIGSELVAGLFLFSLVALIVDCLVANKKVGKKAKTVVQATVKDTNAAVNSSATETSETEVQKQSTLTLGNDSNDSKPETDWRTDTHESEHTEFVGIKDESDNAFDTFDDIEEEEQQPAVDSQEEDSFDIDKILNEEENQEAVDEQPEIENSDDDLLESDNSEDEEDEDLSWIEQGNDEPEFETEEEPKSEEESELEEELKEEQPQEYEQSESEYMGDTQFNSASDNNNAGYSYDDEQIEPNRDIYIPKMRTVVRRSEAQTEIVEKKTATRKTTATGQKRNAAQSSAKKTSSSVNKKNTQAKSAQSKTSTQKRSTSEIPAEKKLPVTRRYVILNRRNAVNMFGEYLKERSQAEKDKLKSSINTIIIE